MKLKLKRLLGLALIVTLLTSPVYANEKFKRNSLYLEFGGQGVFLSINADYRFHPNLTLRLGLCTAGLAKGIPVSLNYITEAKSAHHTEIGLGITFLDVIDIFTGFHYSISIPTAVLGYRYQKKNGGFVIRSSFTPLLGIITLIQKKKIYYELKYASFGGFSVGYCF